MAVLNPQSTVQGSLHVTGTLSCSSFTPPANLISSDSHVAADVGIAASKLEHQYQPIYAQNGNVAAAADKKVVHTVIGEAGNVLNVYVGVTQACVGDSTITVDVLKNGSSILNSTVVLDNTNTAHDLEAGSIDDTDLEADDVLEVSVTVSAGTGTLGQGVFCVLRLREDANP